MRFKAEKSPLTSASTRSVGPRGGDRRLGALAVLAAPAGLRLLLAGRRLVAGPAPGRDRGGGGLRGGAVGLLGGAARVVLTEVLVEDGLEGEALAADVAVERLVARVLADVVLQLVLARVLLPADATDERRDAHVEPHVPVQTALLVEGLAAVDAGEAGVVAEPAVPHLLPQVVLVAAHIERSVLLPLQDNKDVTTTQNLTGPNRNTFLKVLLDLKDLSSGYLGARLPQLVGSAGRLALRSLALSEDDHAAGGAEPGQQTS